MTLISKITRGSIVYAILVIIFLTSCNPTPQVIEITRVVPQTVVFTQIITQVVTPEPTLTSTPTTTPVVTIAPTQGYSFYYPIEECAPSVLYRGMVVYVSTQGGSNAIRSYPDTSTAGNVIGYAIPGEYLRIIGGPVCNFHWLLWQVETNYGLVGWTPEGDGTNWWLIPLEE